MNGIGSRGQAKRIANWAAALVVAIAATDARAQVKRRATGRSQSEQKARSGRPDAPRSLRSAQSRRYLRTRNNYRHVRVSRRARRSDGRIDIRPVIVRSTRIRPVVLERFENRRREQVGLVLRYFREGDRTRALVSWGLFVDGLVDYGAPIDLDDVMLYITREAVQSDSSAVRLRAARLEHLRLSAASLRNYLSELTEQRERCSRSTRPCPPEVSNILETELIRARADLEIAEIEARTANRQFEATIESSRDYESRFAILYNDMYREVELRVQFSR